MFKISKTLRFWIIGTFTCLFLTGLFSTVGGRAIASLSFSTARPTLQMEADRFLGQALTANLQQSQAVLLAQGTAGTSLKSYVAVMSEDNVVASSPTTMARGAVGAALSGNRLIVRGSFKRLSSAPRNYATDPVNPPNSDITSAFHIHQGAPSENGPFQYALDVNLDDTDRGGRAMGEYTLTPEQMQALADGRLYVDIHTTQNRGGELRGTLMPY
ncbi:MAG: CHRD domain-containing protein [Phormidesmis sp.]